MCRIAGEEQLSVAHRGLHEAAERQHALVDDRTFLQRETVLSGQPALQFGPDPVVGPVVGILGRVALEVHALHRLRALTDQREAERGTGVDQFGCATRSLGEDAEPGERILAEQSLRVGDEVAADAARAIGATTRSARISWRPSASV